MLHGNEPTQFSRCTTRPRAPQCSSRGPGAAPTSVPVPHRPFAWTATRRTADAPASTPAALIRVPSTPRASANSTGWPTTAARYVGREAEPWRVPRRASTNPQSRAAGSPCLHAVGPRGEAGRPPRRAVRAGRESRRRAVSRRPSSNIRGSGRGDPRGRPAGRRGAAPARPGRRTPPSTAWCWGDAGVRAGPRRPRRTPSRTPARPQPVKASA